MESGATRRDSPTRARRKTAFSVARMLDSRADKTTGGAKAFSVSDRLRQLRAARGLSLEQLAKKARLTKGFLSLIERGMKAPSISSLLRLSEVYGLSIGALLDGSKPDEPAYSLVRRDARKKFAREGSLYGYRYEALAFRKKRKRMEPFIVSPPLRVPRPFFEHEGDEMVYVLSGQVEIQLGSEKIRLTPGDCIYFDAQTPHRSRSIGRERAQTLVVVDANSFDR
jgi:transcriptional regulator with XRE-family HTH domain